MEPAEDRRPLSARFVDAVGYATEAHAGQVRKGTSIPYLSHLLAAAALVLEDGGDEDEAIAALLHDTAEDQGGRGRLEDVRRRFGDRVAQIVEGCTDSLDDPKPPWRGRKERYVEHLREAPSEVLRVALADKLHNARAMLADYRGIGDRLWERFNAGGDDHLWYHRILADTFLVRKPGWMADELHRVVTELERLAHGR